ncbi:hypothetical protein CC79DRAFT_450084 [Sarocladium strictum]
MATTHLARPYAPRESSYHNQPAHPPSPPMEESKYSLPSISNLISLADAGSPTSEVPPSQLSPRTEGPSTQRHRFETPALKNDSRPGSGYAPGPHGSRGLPPTPPMSVDASFESRNSPSAQSVSQLSTTSAPSGYYHETTPPLEADPRRPAPRTQLPHYPHQAPAPTSYPPGPPAGLYAQAPPPAQTLPQVHSLFYQRPLPQAFPPPMPVAVGGSNPWQHHHYLNPSHGPSYPQSQDRYICQTCNKAFSRPSSLRIHCHSHTGEKPFKCPHAGCGKAFSVRSNMKRHERGCHSFEVTPGMSR